MIITHATIKSPLIPKRTDIEKIVRSVFRFEKKKLKGDLSVIFVDNKMIRQLNKKFLNEPHNTDVIAFPYDATTGTKDAPFGDIYISIPEAKTNAKRFLESPHREVIRLIIHGTLHLLGYDDHNPKDKSRMWKVQEELVHRFDQKQK